MDGPSFALSADPAADLRWVLLEYQEEIRRCQYGTFRGIIKEGRVVVFAIEHEWRPVHVSSRKVRRKQKNQDSA